MLTERESESSYLGQFIPIHYHHNMLTDVNRMGSFRAAIERVVFPGAKVLELGGGTGVLSWFAAQQAEKVWCVEFNPDMVSEARRLLAQNRNGQKVEVVHADAFEYLPPEPVDVVICEMIHVAMLREKQIEVIESFKQRYTRRFGPRLPAFIPSAVIMGVQPLQQDYAFEGYHAPIIQFQQSEVDLGRSVELAPPAVYSILDFEQPNALSIAWQGEFRIERDGVVNALRFITKNVLALLPQEGTTIDWFNHYMLIPLERPARLTAGDVLQVAFKYRTGGSIGSLQASIGLDLANAVEQQATGDERREAAA